MDKQQQWICAPSGKIVYAQVVQMLLWHVQMSPLTCSDPFASRYNHFSQHDSIVITTLLEVPGIEHFLETTEYSGIFWERHEQFHSQSHTQMQTLQYWHGDNPVTSNGITNGTVSFPSLSCMWNVKLIRNYLWATVSKFAHLYSNLNCHKDSG